MTDKLDLAIHCEAIESLNDSRKLNEKIVELKNVDMFNLVNQIGAKEFISHLGADEVAEVLRSYGFNVERGE